MSEPQNSLSRRGFVAASVAALALTSNLAQSQIRSAIMQATIRANGHVITLVNVFTVEPENLSGLIDLLRSGTET